MGGFGDYEHERRVPDKDPKIPRNICWERTKSFYKSEFETLKEQICKAIG